MSAADLDSEIVKQFRNSGVEKHSTILLGAGASITSGLPDWDTFVIRLLVKNGSLNDELAKLLLARQDPLIVVESAREASGEKWEQNLKNSLYKDVSSLDPPPLHLAAVDHYIENVNATSLVTLNFDTLLEEALEAQTQKAVSSLSSYSEEENGQVVHHLHGIITPSETKDVILSLRDFTGVIANQESWQAKYLNSAISRGALFCDLSRSINNRGNFFPRSRSTTVASQYIQKQPQKTQCLCSIYSGEFWNIKGQL